MEWQHISTAPRDGRWLLLRNENYRVTVGRWRPESYAIGEQPITYEWEVLYAIYDHSDDPDVDEAHRKDADPLWNHWCDGYACDWAPLPALKEPA